MGITVGGEHWDCRRRRQLEGPERVSPGVTEGESAAVTGGVIGRTGGGVAGGVERRHYQRGRLQA